MTAYKRQFLLRFAGVLILFAVLEWAAGQFLVRDTWPYVWSVIGYILPALPLFAIIPLVNHYAANRPDEALSKKRLAPARRYMIRLGISMFFYVVVLMFSVAALNRFDLALQIKVIMAILTALPIGAILWAVSSFMFDQDVDEFERMILARSVIVAATLTFFFTAIWGFLENFAAAPDFPLYIVVVVYFGLFGIVQPFVRRGFK